GRLNPCGVDVVRVQAIEVLVIVGLRRCGRCPHEQRREGGEPTAYWASSMTANAKPTAGPRNPPLSRRRAAPRVGQAWSACPQPCRAGAGKRDDRVLTRSGNSLRGWG